MGNILIVAACVVVVAAASGQAAETLAEQLDRINAASDRTAEIHRMTERKSSECGIASVGQCVVIGPNGPGGRAICERLAAVAANRNWRISIKVGDRPLLVDRLKAKHSDDPDWLWLSGTEAAIEAVLKDLVEQESTVPE